MEGWAGFSDADLRKFQQPQTKQHGSQKSNKPTQGRRPQQSSLMAQKRTNTKRPSSASAKENSPPADSITPEQMLSKQKPAENKPQEKKINNTGSHGHTTSQEASEVDKSETNQNTSEPPNSEVTDTAEDLITDDSAIFEHEACTMENFQKQQKMIEELNKKKKQMLHSAIKERAKAAKAESAKLNEIQQELNKLDQLLTVDVSIIRDKIETASREFFDAQKRYDRAEKEYVDAKMSLHQKMDTKEQLTEHLYTVIYQNEMRKGKKLAELMTKLEMEAGETPDISEVDMPHPSLLSPVQLPVGRYGQIGLINTKSPPMSPDSTDPAQDKSDRPTETTANKTEPGSDNKLEESEKSKAETTPPDETTMGQSETKQEESNSEKLQVSETKDKPSIEKTEQTNSEISKGDT